MRQISKHLQRDKLSSSILNFSGTPKLSKDQQTQRVWQIYHIDLCRT